MSTRVFLISFLVLAVLLFVALKIHWIFFTHSVTLESIGQSQACFENYVAVLDDQNRLKVYDQNLTPLRDPKVTVTPDKTLLLTAFEPPCVKLPGKSCLQKFIKVHESQCKDNVHNLVAKLDREQYVFKIHRDLELSVTVRFVKKNWLPFSGQVTQLTLQSGGTLRNFPLTENVNDPMVLKSENEDLKGLSSNRISLSSYTYVKGTLKLHGLVLIPSENPVTGIDSKNPAIAAAVAHLPPLCLRSESLLGDEITIRSKDRRTFSLTIVLMTLEGPVHEFYDDIENQAANYTSSIENAQHGVTLESNERGSLWDGSVKGQPVFIGRRYCEDEEATDTPAVPNGSKLASNPLIHELKCVSEHGRGVGLIVSDSDVLLFRSARTYRLIQKSPDLKSSGCHFGVFYPHDWQRLVAAYKTIENECVVAGNHRCTLGPYFEASCGSDKVPVFIKAAGDGYFRALLGPIPFSSSSLKGRAYEIFSINESEMKFYTKFQRC